MSIKLHKATFSPNLTGATLIGFLSMERVCQSKLSAQTGRNLWSTITGLCHSAVNGLDDREKMAELVSKLFRDANEALSSKIVATALADAGYGELHQIVATEDGKEGASKSVSAGIAARYGIKFKLGGAIKSAQTTLKQYFDNILNAISLGVLDFHGKSVSELVSANRDAADNADPSRRAEREANKTASNVGSTYAAFYKGADTDLQTVINMVTGIAENWKHVNDDDRETLAKTLAEILEPAEAAGLAAKAEAEAEANARAGKEVAPAAEPKRELVEIPAEVVAGGDEADVHTVDTTEAAA